MIISYFCEKINPYPLNYDKPSSVFFRFRMDISSPI